MSCSPSGKAKELGVPHKLTGSAANVFATCEYNTPFTVVMLFQPLGPATGVDVARVIGRIVVKHTFRLSGRTNA